MRSICTLLAALLALLAAPVHALELQLLTPADNPTYVAHAGDDRLFVVERAGLVRVFDPSSGLAAEPFLDVSDDVETANEGALTSIAFHPDYLRNGLFFISYTRRGKPTSVLMRYRVSPENPDVADSASGIEVFQFRRPSNYHNGGQLQFGPRDGHLYFSSGDGGGAGDPRCYAQQSSPYGKIFRFDVNRHLGAPPYLAVPADNPHVKGATNALDALIWATGLRNPWRFSFDRETGDLYIGDSGHHRREEIDFQPADSPGGENYGWKIMEGKACSKDLGDRRFVDPEGKACPPETPPCFDERYTDPIHDYKHADGNCAVIGGYVYRGKRMPALVGTYLYSDACSGRIWGLKRDDQGVWHNRELLGPTQAVFSFGEDMSGELYVTKPDGVYRIVPATPPEGD